MNDDLREVFAQLGIEPGQWVESKQSEYEPEILVKQKELLEKVKGLLEAQVQDDLKTIAKLREELHRDQFGGGK